MRCEWFLTAFLVVSLLPVSLPAEDMQLRAQAIQLLNTARAAATLPGSFIMQTSAEFTGTDDDGTLRSGTYTRLRTDSGALRQEVRFGNYHTIRLTTETASSAAGPVNYPPFAVRRLFTLVPFMVGQFEPQDVVRAMRDGSALGQQATCIDYDSIHGEHHSSNSVCLSKSEGLLLSVSEDGREYEYSQYASVAGAHYPRHIDYREQRSNFALSIDLTLARLDRVPAGTLTPPPDGDTALFCKTSTAPIPTRAPQPEVHGGPDAPVVDVTLRVWITTEGTVITPQIVHPDRPDLDAEARKLVTTWLFRPPTCNGQPNGIPADITLHFQGRN